MRHFFSKHPFSPLLFVVFAFSFGCCKPPKSISPEAEKYLKEVLALLQQHSVNRHDINWNDFTADVFRVAQNSQTVRDTYPAVAYAVAQLNDSHSYFVRAVSEGEAAEDKPLPTVEDEKTPADIGYIRVPFCMGDAQQTEQYIAAITEKISRQNGTGIKGWVIDLRDNFGGNMWPMMAALGPFLDSGTQGYFVDADAHAVVWRFADGKAYSDKVLLAESKCSIALSGRNKIAVLINNRTASSGEAMAVLFKGYASAKLFGVPTFGVSTGCESFTLSDGSRINLATSVFADRSGTKYGKAIAPDFRCAESETLSEAIAWIRS